MQKVIEYLLSRDNNIDLPNIVVVSMKVAVGLCIMALLLIVAFLLLNSSRECGLIVLVIIATSPISYYIGNKILK